jgi:MFS family permease
MVVQERRVTTQIPAMSDDLGNLRHHADFNRLWTAQSVSLFGSAITLLAIPLIAVILLNASALQMGLLTAAGTAPYLFCSLPMGVWIDRRSRRPLLIASDLIRALLLFSIPIAAWLDRLHLVHLYLVALVVGMLNVLFDVAHCAYVPSLVGRTHVVEANSKLQISYSVADSTGPGAAGMVVQLLSAPAAIVIDATSFLVSAFFIRGIRQPEAAIDARVAVGFREEITEGLRSLLGNRLLRPIVLGSITSGISLSAIAAMLVLYASRELGANPFMIGLLFAAAGIGAIPGALLSTPTADRFGVGPTITIGWFLAAATSLAIPLVTGPFAIPILTASAFLGGIAATIVNVQQWSLRQLVTPNELQGRVTASHRFLVYGAEPIGALLGGALGTAIGLRPTIAFFAIMGLTAPLWVACSPVWRLREHPSLDRQPTDARNVVEIVQRREA